MQSQAKTVNAYLQEVPVNRQKTLNKLRQLCLKILVGYQESMEYGMPCYKRADIVEVAFASQKNYISLYILKESVVIKNKPLLKNLKVGKSCIQYQYTQPEAIDFKVVAKLLMDTVASSDQVC